MRYVGIILMAGAVTGVGWYGAGMIRMKLEVLLIFRRMISHLKDRILYGNDPLPEALLHVGTWFEHQQRGRFKEPGKLLLRIAKRMDEEHTKIFGEIWEEEVRAMVKKTPMAEGDLRNLLELGENLGYADRMMQERMITFYLERAEASIDAMKMETETKSKLYRSLGAAAGLFLIVVLI